jgi:TfoX/Sxy family transcriptional regulator of competence genes
METELGQIGIRTEDDLRALGAVAAFVRLRTAGATVSLNALYAMDAALQDRHWLNLDEARRRELKAAAAFDDATSSGGPRLASWDPRSRRMS